MAKLFERAGALSGLAAWVATSGPNGLLFGIGLAVAGLVAAHIVRK